MSKGRMHGAGLPPSPNSQSRNLAQLRPPATLTALRRRPWCARGPLEWVKVGVQAEAAPIRAAMKMALRAILVCRLAWLGGTGGRRWPGGRMGGQGGETRN